MEWSLRGRPAQRLRGSRNAAGWTEHRGLWKSLSDCPVELWLSDGDPCCGWRPFRGADALVPASYRNSRCANGTAFQQCQERIPNNVSSRSNT